ncbi:hypothetical protein GCM10027285_01630 [Oleiagrimonas citrea]|uniref:Uncharacterized protein n=1 Tax=Oleiagrimonas citrea TaxID=1665687 RepID=A0A846ZNY4_9GAMM|nr:hypothetical protein [Oleiagrimonas citrea]NKZ39914.1 hypothetical protein [Oleiagrimonas citrea]
MHDGFLDGFAACLEAWLDAGLTSAILRNGGMASPAHAIDALHQTVSKQQLATLTT